MTTNNSLTTSRPTIYDVAKQADVSIATVSRVLNAADNVRETTRQRVQTVIDQLGFIPKSEARERAMKDFGRIGVITPFFTAPSFVQRLRGIAQRLVNTRYELIIYTVDSIERKDHYLITLPITGYLDGLIFLSLSINETEKQRLLDQQIETVLIEYPMKEFNSVEIDDIQGGRMAARYLLDKGHNNLAFIGDTDLPEYALHPVSLRLKGFKEVLDQEGIDIPEHLIQLAPYSLEHTRKIAKDMLIECNPRPSAIFAATDLQAMGVLKASRELGLRVSEDLAVIGFDDLDVSDFIGLTTIRQPLDESGRLAVEILLSRFEDSNRPVQHVRLPLNIIERETV